MPDLGTVRERARVWGRMNRGRKYLNDKAWRQRNPEKVAAQNAVHYALRKGKLIRLPCEVCGAQPVHAHHDDYSRKLDVRWLCVEHHAEADMNRRAA